MSPKLPVTTPRKIIAALRKMGFNVHRQKGSHVFLRRHESPGQYVNVPYHNRDIKKGTLKIILKQVEQAGEDPDKLIDLL